MIDFFEGDGFHRITETDMHKSVREVLANALIHADYHGRQGIVMERRYEQLSISNPGTLRISREVAIEGGRSDPRNTSIFNAFALINIGDRSGTGLCDLYSRWSKLGLPQPLLTESYDPARTHLSISLTSAAGKVKVKKSVSSAKVKGRFGKVKKVMPSLPASVRAVCIELSHNSEMTYVGLQEKLGFSSATIAKAIGHLVSHGYVSRAGGRKSGRWIVRTEDGNQVCAPQEGDE